MVGLTILFATLLLWMPRVTASRTSDTVGPVQSPSTQPVPDQLTSHGCYKSLSATATGTKVTFVSSGSCWEQCRKEGKNVVILQGSRCFCADTYPPRSSLIDDDQCDYGCPGYDREACGSLGNSDGSKAYSVFNSGREVDVDYDENSSKATATSTSPPSSASDSSTSDSSGSAFSASDSSASASAASASAVSDSTASASTTITNTSEPTSTPSQSAAETGNDANYKSSGVHAMVGIFLALII